MADKVQFDLVSPERLLSSVEASEVQIPGAEGDMTALPDHAPLITTLRPGVLKVTSDKGTEEYVVTGGFAEINPAGISVLAERALPKEDMTQEHMDKMVEEARANLDKAKHAFEDLLQIYPGSSRADDARARIAEIGSADIKRSFDIAEFYYKKGETSSAAFYYEEVLRNAQSGKLHDRARQRLDSIKGS